ncbi:vesicle-associated protein 1-2-like isoform X2 [Miscanthus floridulus]|uniref:vesicle-associated protein 1-2-like isoform X2 n=1 Tax=Miscanthus floridulus TaxID=154761 RepID=UPI003457BC93
MNTESGELLGIDPIELRFPFELNKQISCTLQLTNKTDKQVAFKVKTTSPKKYCVRPNNGMVAARSKADVVGNLVRSHNYHDITGFILTSYTNRESLGSVTMQAQRDVPPDMQCKDKFLVQSAIVAKEIMPKEVTGDMFTKDSGNIVDEVKLKAVYVAPSSSQSEGYEDGNLGSLSYQEPFALISKLMEEKNSAVELNNKLRQELDLLRRDISRQHGGFSLVLVLVVAILGILLGFLMKR